MTVGNQIEDQSGKRWYVLRDLKRANANERAFQMLKRVEGEPIEVFTPLMKRAYERGGRKIIVDVPVVSDLLFVHSSRRRLDPIIADTPTLQYRYVKGGKQNEPMTVRDEEMNLFMAAVSGIDDVKYYTPEEVSPALYDKRIVIIGGRLDGYEGRLKTTRGSRVKRLIVELPGLLAAGVEVDAQYIKLVK